MKSISGKCSCGQWDRPDQPHPQGPALCLCPERGWSCLASPVELGHRAAAGGKLSPVTSSLPRFPDGSCGWGVASRERAGHRRGYGLSPLGASPL